MTLVEWVSIISKGEMMRILFLIMAVLVVIGCSEQNQGSGDTNPAATATFITSMPPQANTVTLPASQTAKIPPIEAAHNDYLAAYDNYVRLLRESGPQTLDTLQALADYQKKYQFYQMLLKADKEGAFTRP